jgi:hypothetical protein
MKGSRGNCNRGTLLIWALGRPGKERDSMGWAANSFGRDDQMRAAQRRHQQQPRY